MDLNNMDRYIRVLNQSYVVSLIIIFSILELTLYKLVFNFTEP